MKTETLPDSAKDPRKNHRKIFENHTTQNVSVINYGNARKEVSSRVNPSNSLEQPQREGRLQNSHLRKTLQERRRVENHEFFHDERYRKSDSSAYESVRLCSVKGRIKTVNGSQKTVYGLRSTVYDKLYTVNRELVTANRKLY